MKRRIVFLAKFLPPFLGGMETTTREICGLLRELGYHVTLVGIDTGDSEIPFADECIRLRSLGGFMGQPLFMPGKLRESLKRADLIVHNFPHPLLDFYSLGVEATPRITVFHSEIHKGIVGRVLNPLTHKLLRQSKQIVAFSPYHVACETLKPFENKCHVIPFGIDVPALPSTLDEGFVLSVGRLVPYKGYENLIRSMEFLSCPLVIVGSGPFERRLRRLARKLKIEKRIRFMGSVSQSTLHELYASCSLYVLSSNTPQETYGVSLLEAMSFAKPVVTTNIETGVNFLNRPYETGLVADKDDFHDLSCCINILLSDSQMRERMGRAARQRVISHFSSEKMKSSWRSLLQENIEAHKHLPRSRGDLGI